MGNRKAKKRCCYGSVNYKPKNMDALGDGISAVFKRSPGKLSPLKSPRIDSIQLELGFT
jgi:hypothetical protein